MHYRNSVTLTNVLTARLIVIGFVSDIFVFQYLIPLNA